MFRLIVRIQLLVTIIGLYLHLVRLKRSYMQFLSRKNCFDYMNMQWFMVQIQLLFVFNDLYLSLERFERGLKEKYYWGKIDLIIEDMCLL